MEVSIVTDADSTSTCFQIPDGATLLLVDDDPSLRRSLRRILESRLSGKEGKVELHVRRQGA